MAGTKKSRLENQIPIEEVAFLFGLLLLEVDTAYFYIFERENYALVCFRNLIVVFGFYLEVLRIVPSS